MTYSSSEDKETADLRQRLNKAEEALRAITGGEVDALVVKTRAGEQIYTLQGTDIIYRTAVENVNEGILTLSAEGIIIYSNQYFAQMVEMDLNKVLGTSIYRFISPQSRSRLTSIFTMESARDEIPLLASSGKTIPAYIAVKRQQLEKSMSISAVITDLTQQKHGEQVMAAGRLVNAINSIFREYMASGSLAQLGKSCLTVAEELTGSNFGFIAARDPGGTFRDLSINEDAWDVCIMHDKSGRIQQQDKLPVAGLYGLVLTEGKSIISNEPVNHPAGPGIPESHPAISSFLGVPLIYQGKTIGLIALANRERGYGPEEVKTTEALVPAVVEVLMRKRAEEEVSRYREHLEYLVAERTRELRDLAHRLVDAQEKERAVIGSSLHDEIGQFLTYTILLIDKASRKPDPKILEEAKSTVQEAISKIRDLSSMLSPKLLRSAGLIQAVESLVEDYTRRTKVNVRFTHDNEFNHIPEEVSLACYRIVQESLTNTIRHAKATEVKIKLYISKDTLQLEVYDNGAGFDPDKMKKATGLTGMRERAVALGGDFSIESNPGSGTLITAAIPISERKKE